MPNNELQEILGARFEKHTHPTGEAVWSAIEAQLDAEKTNRKGIWFWIFNGIAATFLFSCMIHTAGSGEDLNASRISVSKQSEISQTTNEQTSSELNQEKEIAKTKIREKSLSENSSVANLTDQSTTTSGVSQKSLLSNHSTVNSNYSEGSDLMNGSSHNVAISTTDPLSKSENLRMIDETRKVINERDAVNTSLDINELTYLPLASSANETSIRSFNVPGTLNLQKGSGPIPIHLGAEFSYLKKHRAIEDSWTPQSTDYSSASNNLANNRQFEISLFAQFDFTSRFSTSFGLGYSHSSASFINPTDVLASPITVSNESKMHVFTLPVQTKFNFFSKKRIALNGGLTLQGEFGRIIHLEEQTLDATWTASTTVNENLEASIVSQTNLQQFALEPYFQLSVQLTPRIAAFSNAGYRMYVIQNTPSATSIDRLNYFNADVGLLLRLR